MSLKRKAMKVTTPGGAVIQVNGLKMADFDKQANIENLDKDPKNALKLLEDIFRVVELGPMYSKMQEQAIARGEGETWSIWEELCGPDYDYLLAMGRAAAHGPLIQHELSCPKCPVAGHTVNWREDTLIHQIPVTPMTEDHIKMITDNGVTFQYDGLSYPVVYSVASRISRKLKAPAGATASKLRAMELLDHIVSVNGVTDPTELLEWVEDLTMMEHLTLVSEIQKHFDGVGLARSRVFNCPHCNKEHPVLLPFSQGWSSHASPEPSGQAMNMRYLGGLRMSAESWLCQALKKLDL